MILNTEGTLAWENDAGILANEPTTYLLTDPQVLIFRGQSPHMCGRGRNQKVKLGEHVHAWTGDISPPAVFWGGGING
jgi:hypothetical protein